VRDQARQRTDTAISTLVEICQHSENDTARVAAAIALLDRGWGKATAAVAVHQPGPSLLTLVEEAYRDAAEVTAPPVETELARSPNWSSRSSG